MTADPRWTAMVEAAARAIFEASGTARLQTWERYRAFYHERGVLSPDYYAQADAALIARFDAAEDGPALAAIADDAKATEQRAWLKDKRPELSQDVEAAAMAAQQRVGVGA